MTGQTLIEQYNQRVAGNVVDGLFKAMNTIQRTVYLITAIAMATSYLHQLTTLRAQGAAWLFAALMPLSLDALMVVLMKVASLKGIPNRSRWIARGLLCLPASASMALNFLGAGTVVLRSLFVFVVLAIVIGEVAQGLIKPDFAALERATEAVAVVPAAQVAEDAARAARRERDRVRRAAKRAAEQAEAERKAVKAQAARDRRARQATIGDLVEVAELEAAFAAEDAPVSPAPAGS